MASRQFEAAVDEVDVLVDGCRLQVLDAGDYLDGVIDVVLRYLGDEDPRDDVALLVDYCVGWADQVGGLGLFADRTLAAEVRQRLGWCLERQLQRLCLDELLESLDHGLRLGDDDARTQLVDLCAEGVGTHPRLFSASGWGTEVLRLAYDHGQSRALHAALRPTHRDRLATPRRDGGAAYWLALACLGHLAVDPVRTDAARIARQGLVDLVSFFEIGADAVVRLPPHLLEDDDREALARTLERREDVERRWSLDGFACRDLRRDTELLRTVLWQSADCRQVGITL